MRGNFVFLNFSQFAEELFLLGCQFFRNFDIGLHVQIACRTTARIRHAAAAHAEHIARLRTGGDS